MSATSLTGLVGALLDARPEDVPRKLLRRASAVIMDTVAVAWTATQDPGFRALHLSKDERGNCSTVGREESTATAETAAFCNATAAVWNELDEGFRGAGHPAAHIVPASVAVAEDQELDGPALVMAVLRGYQLQSELGLATTLRDEVHAHGAFGAPAAALAVSSLLGLDAQRATHAVNIAANLAPAGLWKSCLLGDSVRNVFAGAGAQIGIRAAQLAAGGMTAPADSCDIGYGVVRGTSFSGWASFTGSWALGTGYLKEWAACAYAHTTLDAVDTICRAQSVLPAQVLAVTVHVPAVGALLSGTVCEPALAVRFSLPVLVALLISGADVRQPGTARQVSEAVRELASRVVVTTDGAMTGAWPGRSTARVVITLRDQRSFSCEMQDTVTPGSDEEFVDAVVSKGCRLHGTMSSPFFMDRIDSLLDATRVSSIFSPPASVLDAFDTVTDHAADARGRKWS